MVWTKKKPVNRLTKLTEAPPTPYRSSRVSTSKPNLTQDALRKLDPAQKRRPRHGAIRQDRRSQGNTVAQRRIWRSSGR